MTHLELVALLASWLKSITLLLNKYGIRNRHGPYKPDIPQKLTVKTKQTGPSQCTTQPIQIQGHSLRRQEKLGR